MCEARRLPAGVVFVKQEATMAQNPRDLNEDTRPQDGASKGNPDVPSHDEEREPRPSGDSLKKQGDKLEDALE